jgi:signal transduction histidine kinase
MNTMARRLDQLIQGQRAFVSDASHQLRTPLTALRLRLENLETQLTTEPDRTEIGAAIGEVERLSELVNGLLQLARAEETPPTTPVDAATLVSERVDTWTAVADNSQIAIRLVSPPPPRYAAAVSGAIEQMLDNTLDNALNASPPNSTVTVELASAVDRTRITISDQGPGLDAEARSRALERFWRGDATTPGTGLGLAIARTLAEASEGSLTLEDNADGGLSVVISLPTVAAPISEPDARSPRVRVR